MTWRTQRGTWASIIIALLLWASAFPGIRAALAPVDGTVGTDGFGPGELALLRFGTASLVLFAYALVARMKPPAMKDLPRIALAGVCGITIYHVALNFGERTVMSGAAALLIATSPIFTALLSTRFLGERLTVFGWSGIALSFAGAAVIAVGEGGGVGFNVDALLILVSAVVTSVYFVLSKEPLTRYSALDFTSYAIWAGTIPMLCFAPGLLGQLPDAPVSATLSGLYLGVFPGAIAYVLWSRALSRMPATVLSTFLYFQPANAALVAWVWLGEVPTALTLLGGIVSIVGVVIVNTRGTEKPVPVGR